jgi:hypothetical protein
MGQYVEVTADHGELSFYSMGPWVTWAQELLHKWGWSLGPKGVDGYFGPYTKVAVEAFQNDKGLPATGVVDTTTWRALEAPKIVFSVYPTVNANSIGWTIRNDGFAVRAAGKSAGLVAVYERNRKGTVVFPEENIPTTSDLGPGGTFPVVVDALRMSPLDGEFTAEVRLKLDLAAVDYDVVNGVVAAPGTFAAQPPAPANPVPRMIFHTLPRREGTRIVWDTRNVGAGYLYANDPVGDVDVWKDVASVFNPGTQLAPNDIPSLAIQRIVVELGNAGLPDGDMSALVTPPSGVTEVVSFKVVGGMFTDP